MATRKIETKSVDYLINQLRIKQDNNAVPTYTLLIGAGCSYHAGIPLGGEVIELLKREIFRLNNISDEPKQAGLDLRGEYSAYVKNYDVLLDKKNLTGVYKKFEEDNNAAIKKEIDAFTK